MTKWKDIYNSYRKLKIEWENYGCNISLDSLLFETKEEDFDNCINVLKSEIKNIVLQIKSNITNAIEHKPVEDVYQAALHMIGTSYWEIDTIPPKLHVYRGQRKDTWPITPTLLRNNPPQTEIKKDLDRLACFCGVLKSHKCYALNQYPAIAQHYSSEAKVKTWLVDFTYNPWVALFFASLNGQNNDLGKITCVSLGEWGNLSAGGKNPLYDIKKIDIPTVPRIKAQEATFIETHPDLIEQYVAMEMTFKQREGLLFEDPLIGITEQNLLYSLHDSFLDFAKEWKKYPSKGRLKLEKQSNDFNPLTEDDYLAIINSWIDSKENWQKKEFFKNKTEREKILGKLCQFHLLLQKEKKNINRTARSLFRLENAVGTIISRADKKLTLKQVIYDYIQQADTKAAKKKIQNILNSI
ncbi:FRG domain-containing protein [Candidatus Woesearchaeota archaeon]|nr:FRG domain-containing protein [Candidatus Woesearchaeota archaeon]